MIGADPAVRFRRSHCPEVADLITRSDRRTPRHFGSEVFPSPVLQQIADETGARYVEELRDDDSPARTGIPITVTSDYGVRLQDVHGALGGDITPFDSFDVENLRSGDTSHYRY